MIADAHQSIVDWIRDAAPSVPVESRAPTSIRNPGSPDSIVCYLFSAVPSPAPRGIRRGPLQFDLVFLILADVEQPLEGHRIFDALIGSAAERSDIELFDAGLTPQFWSALGAPPAPALTVRLAARWEREQPRAPLVTAPLVVRTTDISRLQGRVLTPDGMPVAGAEIRLSSATGAPARTGYDGRFTLPAASPGAAGQTFAVRARGHLHTITAQPPDAGTASTASDILLIIDPIGVMT